MNTVTQELDLLPSNINDAITIAEELNKMRSFLAKNGYKAKGEYPELNINDRFYLAIIHSNVHSLTLELNIKTYEHYDEAGTQKLTALIINYCNATYRDDLHQFALGVEFKLNYKF